MEKFVVISCNRNAPPIRIHMYSAFESNPNSALRRVGNIRPTSHILLALTTAHLKQWAGKLEKRFPDEIALAKFVVFSCDQNLPVRIHMDEVCESNADSALLRVGNQRQTSHILLALTPAQLRQLADELEKQSPNEIAMSQDAAFREELEYQKAMQAELGAGSL